MCSRCGSEHVVDTWNIETTRNVYGISTILSALFGRLSFKKHKYTFAVPICYTCKHFLRTANQIINAMTLILIVGGFFYLTIESGIFLGLIGGFGGYLLSRILDPIIRLFTNSRVASYYGYKYIFYNKKVMNAYMAMNSTSHHTIKSPNSET